MNEEQKKIRDAADMPLPKVTEMKPREDAAAEPIKEQEHGRAGQAQLPPVCPYCGEDPAKFSRTGVNIPETNGQVSIYEAFYCANDNCRKLFNFILKGMSQPKIVGASGMPPVHRH